MNSYDNATKSPKENKFTGPVFSLPGGKIGTQLQRNCAKKGGRREEEEEEGQKENSVDTLDGSRETCQNKRETCSQLGVLTV